ncbi:dnaJ homolog subfamily C member 25 homolog [Homarus americanus]|uniref:dnaJ homolog subfamily C member 25 homolog n=1 Tax=Homarus americanus TaxID=6706 RepID=UPI001C4960D4|nr:dnaJ homolog subfamily C member 25 homolog [Homarus americanus]
MMWRFLLLYSLCIVFQPTNGYVEDYYCGENNCYDLLEITRDATKQEVKRAFRAVASKTHPDKFQDPEEKKIAEERFRILSTAYDILRDDEAREDYDYMLDHPEQFYQNVYRAWRRRMAPHVDVRIVLAATISLISLVQYYNGWMKYQEAIKYFAVVPKYRLQAVELAKQEGLLITDKKKLKGMSKEQIKEREEKIIRQVIERKMDIRGVYAKPTYKDILWIQLVFLPYWIVKYISWYLRWVWKFWILKEEYGEEEKMYIIRKFMGLSHGQFENLEENIKADYLKRELWNKDKYNEWKADRDAEMKVKMAQSGRYKSYRRYMKANGPGRMYFDDS